jgi:hypothetical protein
VRGGDWPQAWRFDHSLPFTGDVLDATMHWNDAADAPSLAGDVVRLHFGLKNAELYSFWFE